MRRQALEDFSQQAPRTQISSVSSIPAPVKGWNLIDPLPGMDQSYAVQLDNWIPRTAGVELRKGQGDWASGFDTVTGSLIQYSPALSSSRKLFATANAGIYDVSTPGAIGAALIAITEPQGWISTQFSPVGGSYTIACNGVDSVLEYDGTIWAAPAITGVTLTTLSYVNIYEQRLWFVQKNTLDAWYLAAGAITGAATKFPLGTLFRQGGSLVAMGTWSVDAGQGLSDYCVFITDQGETAIYQGVDPTSASTFSLVGVYRLPKPIGNNCFLKYAGDLLVLTQQGVYPISKALQSSSIDKRVSMTYTISPQFAADAANYGTLPGWGMTLFTEDNLLIVNVPGANAGASAQYVMNTITGAWCRFLGLNATSWADFNGKLIFCAADPTNPSVWDTATWDGGLWGGNFRVAQAQIGTSDYGDPISSTLLTAYNYFGVNTNKHIKQVRPNLVLDNQATVSFAISSDFSPLSAYQFSSETFIPTNAPSIWDASLWDASLWGGLTSTVLEWITVAGSPGYALAVGLQTSSSDANIQLVAFDVSLQTGGIL